MRKKKHGHSTRSSETASLSEETLINIGHYHYATERYAIRLAQNQGNPDSIAPIAQRLSDLLADTAVRALSGDPDLVPQMRTDGFAAYQRRKNQVRNVHLPEEDHHDRPSGKRTLSKKARKAIGKAQRERWAKYHEKKAAERERSRISSQARRARGAKQNPAIYRKNRSAGIKGYWARMSEEERSREILRRHAVTAAKKAGGKSAA